MEMAGYKRFLLKTIRKRQLQFFQAYKKTDRLEKHIEWKDLWYMYQK